MNGKKGLFVSCTFRAQDARQLHVCTARRGRKMHIPPSLFSQDDNFRTIFGKFPERFRIQDSCYPPVAVISNYDVRGEKSCEFVFLRNTSKCVSILVCSRMCSRWIEDRLINYRRNLSFIIPHVTNSHFAFIFFYFFQIY